MDEKYFVKVTDPQEIHVLVLQATKRSLEASATHVHIQNIKKERARLVKLLHEQAAHLHDSFSKLAEFFPHNELVDKKKQKVTKQKKDVASVKKTVQQEEQKSSDDKLAKINKSLEEIEKKLGDLVL